MKNNIFFALVAGALVYASFIANTAQALSCLPIDMYLKDVVGKEEIVIFSGTSEDRIEAADYTAEVIAVDEVWQGYAEEKIFVYHEKSVDWGYLCNSGPKAEGSKGVYVTERNAIGKYQVHQRLELTDPFIKTLEADLKKAEVTGQVAEFSSSDRMNQIITTITDLFKQIGILLKEYAYWKGQK